MWSSLFFLLLALRCVASQDVCTPNPCFSSQLCRVNSDNTTYTCYTPPAQCNSEDPNMNMYTCMCTNSTYNAIYGQNSQLGVVGATCGDLCLHNGVATQDMVTGYYYCSCSSQSYYGASCEWCLSSANDPSCIQPTLAPTTLAPTPIPTTPAPTVHITPAPTTIDITVVNNITSTSTNNSSLATFPIQWVIVPIGALIVVIAVGGILYSLWRKSNDGYSSL